MGGEHCDNLFAPNLDNKTEVFMQPRYRFGELKEVVPYRHPFPIEVVNDGREDDCFVGYKDYLQVRCKRRLIDGTLCNKVFPSRLGNLLTGSGCPNPHHLLQNCLGVVK